MAVNVYRLARKTNRKSRKEQQTEELDAPRLHMWSLNPFAHSLHETSPHFSAAGSRGILVDQISIDTFTTPFSLYSSHLTLSELNQRLYDVTLWFVAGLPCVASLKPLADFIISRYPAARVPIWNIIETGSPRFVSSDVRSYRGGGDGRIRQEIVFHSKCINTAFCK